MDLGQQRQSGSRETVQPMFGCSKSAWVGAVPEAATPALAWPPSLCPCPLRRRAARLSGCSVSGDLLDSCGRKQGGKRGRPARPPNTKSRSRGRRADCAELRAGFSQVPAAGGNWASLAGPWAVARGVGEETRRRLALSLGGCAAGIAGTPGPSREYARLGGRPSLGCLLCVLSSASAESSRAHPGKPPRSIHPDLGNSQLRTATGRDTERD